jgi:hypothetical protein
MLICGFIYRATHAEFVIPYEKYITSIRSPVCIGTRFRMRFEMDDSPERRCAGVVTGVCDLDPYRWPNSKWRCLLVRWDESFVSDHQERVSPWEIDPSVSLPHLSIQSSPRPKRPWAGLLDTTPPGNPITSKLYRPLFSLEYMLLQTVLNFHQYIIDNCSWLQQKGVVFWTLRSRLDPLRSCKVKKI